MSYSLSLASADGGMMTGADKDEDPGGVSLVSSLSRFAAG